MKYPKPRAPKSKPHHIVDSTIIALTPDLPLSVYNSGTVSAGAYGK
jgi:hypothetical protein